MTTAYAATSTVVTTSATAAVTSTTTVAARRTTDFTVAPAEESLTITAVDYPSAVRAGALVVDIRSRAQRERQGVLAGAVAVEARPVVELLDPSSPAPLATVTEGRPVVLVSDDGLDAELFALELASRGVRGVRAVEGGHDALRETRALALLSGAEHLLRERSAISAH